PSQGNHPSARTPSLLDWGHVRIIVRSAGPRKSRWSGGLSTIRVPYTMTSFAHAVSGIVPAIPVPIARVACRSEAIEACALAGHPRGEATFVLHLAVGYVISI